MSTAFDPAASRTTIFAAFLDAARRHGRSREILEDGDRQPLTYARVVLGSLVIGAKLARETRPGEVVGVLLPNVAGMVVTLLGLNCYGRAAALLNFTAGPRNLRSAAQTALLRTVVTSRRFVEMGKLEDIIVALEATETAPGRRVRVIYLEDIRASVGSADKLAAAAKSLLAARVHARHAPAPDRPAVILFTSGTEGAPKGVVLTNANLVANAQQIIAHAGTNFTAADTALNPLPMFHSFGLTAGTLMPLLNGMRTVLFPSPLQYKQVARLIRDTRATVLFATDTFAQGYARAADTGDLTSLRFIVCGAERVKDATRRLYERAGTILMEGYGATECSPVIACNLPEKNVPGSVGTLLPGQEVRLEPVEGIAEGGRLIVRGPNVMAGYMPADKPGIIVPPAGGWHDTGDIVTIDGGYITIRGRAKRFAKIGGEMVSLAAVEALASALWPDSNHVVISMPDTRKGEQLTLVTDKPDADKDALLAHARSEGFPELWVPKAILVVANIPVLGSGKVDLPATQELVRQTRALL
jgi:acyl-[acyl-carrier-protein]-phospholipid O-acyltransferase/long-chain-fatty-acid--[acyl-carrier-protein] ligase